GPKTTVPTTAHIDVRRASYAPSSREEIGMKAATGAFTVAERMLGGLTLSVGQLAQLRAIDRKYQQRLFTLLDGVEREPTSAEVWQLDDMAARDIAEMLTPDQRTQIKGTVAAQRQSPRRHRDD